MWHFCQQQSDDNRFMKWLMLIWLILVLLLLIYIWDFCAQAVPGGPLGTLLLLFGDYKILVFS